METESIKKAVHSGLKSLYGSKSKALMGLLSTSFGSVVLYDFVQQEVMYSQWKLLKSLGYAPEDFKDVSREFFRKILHPNDFWIINQHVEKIKTSRQGEALTCIFRIKDKAGRYRWIALRDAVIERNESGEVTQLMGAVLDVTKYRETKGQFNSSLRVMDQIAYRNSHDLRAPVATILGLVTLLRHETRASGDVESLIDSLEVTAERMDEVIREFGQVLQKDIQQLKTHSMENQIVADNKHYLLAVNVDKNRAYLKIKGYWRNVDAVPQYIADWKKTTRLLRRNFTLLTDATQMKTHPQDVRKLHEEAQALLLKSGVVRIAELVQDDIAEIQLDAVAKASAFPKKNFRDQSQAELWLDEVPVEG